MIDGHRHVVALAAQAPATKANNEFAPLFGRVRPFAGYESGASPVLVQNESIRIALLPPSSDLRSPLAIRAIPLRRSRFDLRPVFGVTGAVVPIVLPHVIRAISTPCRNIVPLTRATTSAQSFAVPSERRGRLDLPALRASLFDRKEEWLSILGLHLDLQRRVPCRGLFVAAARRFHSPKYSPLLAHVRPFREEVAPCASD